MQKAKITMEVPADTARAFERASVSEKRRAEEAVALVLRTLLADE